MSVLECERLAQEYAKWLFNDTKVEAIGEVCVITTPFVDHHRDLLQIYVRRTDSGLLISDDGYVIRDLRINGMELTERRGQALSGIVRTLGVERQGDELHISTPVEKYPQAKHSLIQAMLAVGDLIHLAQPTVVALFKEDVRLYLQSKDIRFVADVKLTGSSGLNHSFDFVVGASQRHPERYIRAINSPSKENVVELLFSWQDLRDVRPANASAYAILNDQEKSLSRTLLDALDRYRIAVIPWSDRETQVQTLRR